VGWYWGFQRVDAIWQKCVISQEWQPVALGLKLPLKPPSDSGFEVGVSVQSNDRAQADKKLTPSRRDVELIAFRSPHSENTRRLGRTLWLRIPNWVVVQLLVHGCYSRIAVRFEHLDPRTANAADSRCSERDSHWR
jgi:hypothetical protein